MNADSCSSRPTSRSAMGKIFASQVMTPAAVDWLVHHATILEMNVESYRRRAALHRKRGKAAQPS
jgi:DNA replication protein DnaC